MRDLFTLLSRYNAHANTEMFGILLTAPPELVAEPGGSHYDSILGLLNHILVSDLGWLNAYRESDLTFDALDSRALDFERPSAGALLHDNLQALWSHRKQVDAVLSAFTEGFTDDVLAGTITIRRRQRETVFVLGEVVLHLFNHQTHHRGAVSQILDRHGIENDFSNIVWLLMNR